MDSLKLTPSQSSLNRARGNRAVLYLDGQVVGEIVLKRWGDSWGYGDFRPTEHFADYAPLFGMWSKLMHTDVNDSVSRTTSEELAAAEARLDAINARLLFPQNEEWVDIAQLNIDGELLEWKEY